MQGYLNYFAGLQRNVLRKMKYQRHVSFTSSNHGRLNLVKEIWVLTEKCHRLN